jgi:hypothetical protein
MGQYPVLAHYPIIYCLAGGRGKGVDMQVKPRLFEDLT